MGSEKPHIHLHPGEYYVSTREVVISTLLGSCVSACLFDPVQRIVGMNHFLLSNPRYSRDLPYYITEAGRYGIQAMELIINAMLSRGARKSCIRAKAFGGASLFQSSSEVGNFFCVGQVNVTFIREFLRQENIPLISEDLGGDRGRVIRFHAEDYSVYVRKMRPATNTRLGTIEKQFWQKSIQKQQEAPPPEIWE